jgi:hypothetical protein
LFSESFFETSFMPLAQVSWLYVGGLGLCNPKKMALYIWEGTVHPWKECGAGRKSLLETLDFRDKSRP